MIAEHVIMLSPTLLLVFASIAATAVVTKFVIRTNDTNNAIPGMQALLVKIDKGLTMANSVLNPDTLLQSKNEKQRKQKGRTLQL
jgi:hypothetical protein